MPLYDLMVILQPSRFIDENVFEVATIPANTEIAGVLIHAETIELSPGITQKRYLAELRVSAPSERDAKQHAVRRVRQILSVMSVWNIPLRIEYPGVAIVNTYEDDSPVSPPLDQDRVETTDNKPSTLPTALGWQRFDVGEERDALSWSDSWPEWLVTALELNYLAVISQARAAIVIRFAVLELLESKSVSPPKSIISQKVTKSKRQELVSAIKGIFAEFGLEEEESQRIINHILPTHSQGKADRLLPLLDKVGVMTNVETVKAVIEVRAAIAHALRPVTLEEEYETNNRLRWWLQHALEFALKKPDSNT